MQLNTGMTVRHPRDRPEFEACLGEITSPLGQAMVQEVLDTKEAGGLGPGVVEGELQPGFGLVVLNRNNNTIGLVVDRSQDGVYSVIQVNVSESHKRRKSLPVRRSDRGFESVLEDGPR